jgi:hypothetical protein
VTPLKAPRPTHVKCTRKFVPVSKHNAMKTQSEWRYSSKHSLLRVYMGVRSEFHVQVASALAKSRRYSLTRGWVSPKAGQSALQNRKIPVVDSNRTPTAQLSGQEPGHNT